MIGLHSRVIAGPSLRAKLLGVVVLAALVLGMAAIAELRSTLLITVGAELDKRSLSLANDLAYRVADPLLTRNTLEVAEILRGTLANNPDVRYAFVVDGSGRLVAHTFEGGFPRGLLAVNRLAPGNPATVRTLRSDEGPLHDAAAPIVDGLAGYARVGLSQKDLAASLRRVQQRHVTVVLLVGMATLLLAYLSIRAMTGRIEGLATLARRVGAGDLTARAVPGAPDEVGQLAGAFNEMTARLAFAQQAVRAKEKARTDLLQQLMSAQEAERLALSRELHDEIGQSLTGMIVGLKVLTESPHPDPAHAAELRELAAHTLSSVRHLSRNLRPSVLDDMGLAAALRRYLHDFSRHHKIESSLQVVSDPEARPPNEVETTLYRTAQEALTNVARHSGATHVGVVLDLRERSAAVIIEDNGRGFDPAIPREGVGLTGIAERAALVGGSVTIESRPGGGTTLFVKVPINREEAEA